MNKAETEMKVLQRRRLRAGRRLERGVAQAEVARRVEVSRTTVSEWNKRLQSGGLESLKRRPRGRPAGLDALQHRALLASLKAGALAAGFPTELWTLPRVRELIKKECGRAYRESQVWRIRIGLGYSCRRPSNRSLERDESAIPQWKFQRWPVLEEPRRDKAVSSSSSTSWA